METQLAGKDKKIVFGALLGNFAAIVAIAFVVIMFCLEIFLTIFQMWEGPSELEKMVAAWPSVLFFLVVSTPLAIFAGRYGAKIALINPRKSGWIMFIVGIASLFDGQHFAGIVLIIAGVYTIFFQKPLADSINVR